MKLLLVWPGHSWSTFDVAAKLSRGLRALGHEVVDLQYHRRLAFFERALKVTIEPEHDPDQGQIRQLASDGITIEALRRAPDLVLVIHGGNVVPHIPRDLKRLGISSAVYFTEAPYEDHAQLALASEYDYVFVNDDATLGDYLAVNPHTASLSHCYDPAQHAPVVERDPAYQSDVFFCGTGFPERIRWLEGVDWDRLTIDLKLAGFWPELPDEHPLARRIIHGGSLPNAEVVRYYRGTKIALNPHRGVAEGVPVNMANPRTFELAACGVCQVTDQPRREIGDVFAGAVPVCRSPKDLEKLLLTLLGSPTWRRDLAARARERVAPHTHVARAQQLLDALVAWRVLPAVSSSPQRMAVAT